MSTGGIAVGGVAYLVGEEDPAMQSRMTSLLITILRTERPDIYVEPNALFPRALGREAYAEMLADNRLTGEIAETWLEQLSTAAGDVQYAIFARIERDELELGEARTIGVDTTTYSVSRIVGTGFHIYDLTKRLSVWSGYITETKVRENKVLEVRDESVSGIIKTTVAGVAIDLLGLGTDPYPSPPRLTTVLQPIFEGFAENLPEQATR